MNIIMPTAFLCLGPAVAYGGCFDSILFPLPRLGRHMFGVDFKQQAALLTGYHGYALLAVIGRAWQQPQAPTEEHAALH